MMRCWRIFKGVRIFIAIGLVLGLFGSLADITVDKALAGEKIIIKGVPYVHQKERLD